MEFYASGPGALLICFFRRLLEQQIQSVCFPECDSAEISNHIALAWDRTGQDRTGRGRVG